MHCRPSLKRQEHFTVPANGKKMRPLSRGYQLINLRNAVNLHMFRTLHEFITTDNFSVNSTKRVKTSFGRP